MDSNAAARAGAILLSEVEETSLDEVLHTLRKIAPTAAVNEAARVGNVPSNKLQAFVLPVLNDIVARHFRATRETTLTVSGGYLPFVYALIATLVLPPHNKAVVVIDLNGQFSAAGLGNCSPFSTLDNHVVEGHQPTDTIPFSPPHPTARLRLRDLDHVHVYQPHQAASLSQLMAEAEKFMLYGSHASKDREWWGTIIINQAPTFSEPDDSKTSKRTGALRARPIVYAGYRGWLRVEKQAVSPPLNLNLPRGELSAEISRYNAAAAETGWLASSAWGQFKFRSGPM